MSELKYIKQKNTLLPYCFLALKGHFESEEEFVSWYEQIPSEGKKNKFLKVASYYLALVKSGDWHVDIPGSQPVVEYFTNTFKYIAIFSLIESLSELHHIDFYQYLGRKETKTEFPLTKQSLDKHYQGYKEEYGAIRRCIEFFENLSPERKRLLVSKLKVNRQQGSIEELAKYLYRIRSRFVHEAEFTHQASGSTWMGYDGNKLIVCSLSITDAMQFFEEGLLVWCAG
jgi:hypothetical protein